MVLINNLHYAVILMVHCIDHVIFMSAYDIKPRGSHNTTYLREIRIFRVIIYATSRVLPFSGDEQSSGDEDKPRLCRMIYWSEHRVAAMKIYLQGQVLYGMHFIELY